ncbi:DUF4422 domain-containing protein [Campylobacter coli]|uniref:DUF4422 domain-containing protein n=1 Tax=Campylobacter coli TaxID=195 RepID=UPI0011A179AA|nr:DUF4422 domain-containing protein [Campylobacter coli]
MGCKLKILVGYHNRAPLIKNNTYIPIHLGRALRTDFSKDGKLTGDDFRWLRENMIGDDTGENISQLNRYFNELTGIYWAWKNYDKLDDPEYIGFVHYRRHFIFDDKIVLNDLKKHWSGYSYLYEAYDDKYKDLINNISLENIYKYDIIAANKINLKRDIKWLNGNNGSLQNFFLSYNEDDDILYSIQKILNVRFGDKYKYISDNFLNQDFFYPANMFIMKKELFVEMCHFLFTIAFLLYNEYKYRLENGILWSRRYLAWALEIVTSLFIQGESEKKIKELPISFLHHIDTQQYIDTQQFSEFKKNDMKIVLTSENFELYYLAPIIKSIVENSNTLVRYVIYILHFDIKKERQYSFIKSLKIETRSNIQIEFLNICKYKCKYKINKLSLKEYVQLLIPNIFKECENILYIDNNLIILEDLSKIVNVALNDKRIAAMNNVKAIDSFFKFIIWSQDKDKSKKYSICRDNVLNSIDRSLMFYNIKKCYDLYEKYYQILDMNSMDIQNRAECNFISQFDFIFSSLFKGNTYFLNLSQKLSCYMAFEVKDKIGNFLPSHLAIELQKSYNNYSIIHYDGSEKPYNNSLIDKGEYWWLYLSKTLLLEKVLFDKNKLKLGRKKILFFHSDNIFNMYLSTLIFKIWSLFKNKKRCSNDS